MPYAQRLKEFFPDITLEAEDLLLLETIQIKYLPDRVERKEFATLLSTYPVLHRFLNSKYPPIAPFLQNLLQENIPIKDPRRARELCQEALWEIADLIIYNKHPELYDRNSGINWEFSEISSITPLEGKTVADVGAGSGRIAFLLAPHAQTVFAVEPLNSFRSFMKEKALGQEIHNLFVMDGTLDSIPLPDDSLDVLITSNAMGWNLKEELREIERVVKPGGTALHLLNMDINQDHPYHEILTSSPWKYQCIRKTREQKMKIIYFKNIDFITPYADIPG